MLVEILALLGVSASAYGYYVEQRAKHDPAYRPLCDVGGKVLCSRTLTSRYAHLLGPSNALLGTVFYLAILVLAYLELHTLVLVASVFAVLGSIVLAYLLYTRIREFCLVCTSIYVINIALLIASAT